jgi:hypothetical protein
MRVGIPVRVRVADIAMFTASPSFKLVSRQHRALSWAGGRLIAQRSRLTSLKLGLTIAIAMLVAEARDSSPQT